MTTHAKPSMGTARISSANLEVPVQADRPAAPAPRPVSRPDGGASQGMRVTASRLKRPVAALKMAGTPESPSRAGAYAAGIAAALGVLVVTGILITRKPPEKQVTVVMGAGVQVKLVGDEPVAVDTLATLLINDPSGVGAEKVMRPLKARDAESAARVFYFTLQQFPGNKALVKALLETRSVLAVDAAVAMMTDPGQAEADRLEAARVLHDVTESKPSPLVPGLAKARLVAYLTALKPGERKELVRAAIETYGWERDPQATEDTLRALEAAPGVADWGGSGIGFSDPDEVIVKALGRIDNDVARRRLKERGAKPKGTMDFGTLNPKKP